MTEKWTSGTGQHLTVHSKKECSGRNCPIHNPSNHHMKEWPLHWRDDTRIMERIDPLGCGHPDPDDLEFNRDRWIMAYGTDDDFMNGIHGCNGLCNAERYKEYLKHKK